MISTLKLYAVHAILKRMLKKSAASFMKCIAESKSFQSYYLNRVVQANQDTVYGRKYAFKNIRSVSDYREQVPLITYEDIAPYIEQMKKGRDAVLFQEPLTMFEKTSGSTSPSKYIPFNRSFLNEIHRGTLPWIYNIYEEYKGVMNTTAYWSISPKLGVQEYTEGGIRVGFADDSEYFSSQERFFLKQIFSVDPRISALDPKQFQWESALQLIRDPHLGLISIWNPTLFVLFLEYIETGRASLLEELKSERIGISKNRLSHVTEILSGDEKIDFQALWPELTLISCWTDGAAGLFLPTLKSYFPKIPIQGKGVLMTEGIMTIPMAGMAAPILSVHSHFFEFIPYEADRSAPFAPFGETLLPHELEKEKVYIPVITTGGGLYRYMTGDRLQVKGFQNEVPLFRFLGRTNNIVDLCGEKLNETFVEKIVDHINNRHGFSPVFAMMAPSLSSKPHYIYYVEEKKENLKLKIADLEKEIERLLCESHHYHLCRQLGQLGPVEIVPVEHGQSVYVNKINDIHHQKYGNIKNKLLDANLFWRETFIH